MRFTWKHSTIALLALSLAACSGGGSSPAASPGGSTTLLFDTSTSGGDSLRGTLEVVALEDAQGNFTPNLVSGSVAIDLCDPLGRATGVTLGRVPSGRYVAVHLLFVADSLRSRRADGSEERVDLTRRDVKVWFEETATGSERWLLIRHRGDSAIVRSTSGRLEWTPSLSSRPASEQPLRSAEVDVAGVDVAGGRAVGFLAGTGDMPVTLLFGDDSVLTRGASRHGRDDFLAGLGNGSRLQCDGLLDDKGGLRVSSADDRGRRSRTKESEVLGRILSLDAGAKTLRVQVLSIRYGAADLPRDPLPAIDVLASSAEIHRSGARHVLLGFDVLQVGQLVEVEWRGSQGTGPITAHEIEIEDDAGRNQRPEIEGKVDRVDVASRLILVVPRKDDPLFVGGKSVSSATIRVLDSTVVVRKTDSGRVPIALTAITAQDRIWILGRVVSATSVEATLVRVRDDSR